MKIKKGDKVLILKGKDAGKSGKVIRVLAKDGKVILEGLNLFKRSVRPKRQGQKGQIITVPTPLRVENVVFVCPSCGKSAPLGYRGVGRNKIRFCKKCQVTV